MPCRAGVMPPLCTASGRVNVTGRVIYNAMTDISDLKQLLMLLTCDYEPATQTEAHVLLTTRDLWEKVSRTGAVSTVSGEDIYRAMCELGFSMSLDKQPDNFEFVWALRFKR